MGQPGQRVPIAGMGGCESPDNVLGAQAGLYMRILGNVERIIPIDEIMISHL
jgi:hypothetical protein